MLVAALTLSVAAGVVHAAPPGPSPRSEDGSERRRGAQEPTRAARGDRSQAEGSRHARRAIEEPAASASDGAETPIKVDIVRPNGCGLDGYKALVRSLLALTNKSQLMSLEVWGDTDAYVPFQKVVYYMRSPRPVYVTLFWIGPNHDIYVPFHNLRIPGRRDVSVDPSSIIVPPLGREQWVALATLEPISFDCGASDAAMAAMIRAAVTIPHAIGRWEVKSARSYPAKAP